MRISDWSSDVCSSDLELQQHPPLSKTGIAQKWLCPLIFSNSPRPIRRTSSSGKSRIWGLAPKSLDTGRLSQSVGSKLPTKMNRQSRDRKSVVSGKSVSVRVDLGGGRIIQKKKNKKQ